MSRVRVLVEAQSPLALGDGMEMNNIRTTRNVITGAALRGSIAAAVLDRTGLRRLPDESARNGTLPGAFTDVMMGPEQIHFKYLYPFWPDEDNLMEDPLLDTYPAPLSLFSCKTFPGFVNDGGGHGVLDKMVVSLGDLIRNKTGVKRVVCRKCGERIELMRALVAAGNSGYRVVKTSLRNITRVGLNRLTETSEDQFLYSIQTLSPCREDDPGKKICFAGHWELYNFQEEALKELLNTYFAREKDGWVIHIGTARARGLGRVVLKLHNNKAFETPEEGVQDTTPEKGKPEIVKQPMAIPDRLHHFQEVIGNDSGDDQYIYFSLTARSPLIIFSKSGRPSLLPGKNEYQHYFKSVPESLELIYDTCFVEQEVYSGWSQAWGLPKPVLAAVAPGSILTYRVKAGEKDILLEFLTRLETQGVGEKQAEGLGEIMVCRQFDGL